MDEGDPITVVTAIMRPDRPQQWVLVETSLTGATDGFNETGQVPGGVGQPVLGARVAVSNISFPNDDCGAEIVFNAPARETDDATDGVYWSPQWCPTMRPGDTLELRVDTPDGGIVTGSTVVPGIRRATLSTAEHEQAIPGPMLEFNRDTDTLIASVEPIGGRALQIEVGERPSVRRSWFFVDSTAITLPGNIPDVFIRDFDFDDDVPDLFLAGVYYEFTTAWTDRNYFDFARSMNSPLSGRGFINRLEGGMGLFGSMVAITTELKVVGAMDEAREGFYRLTGVVAGTPVDVVWELYVRSNRFANLGGFVQGEWALGEFDDHLIGDIGKDNRFNATFQQRRQLATEGVVTSFVLEGVIQTEGPFPVTVYVDGDQFTIEGRRINP